MRAIVGAVVVFVAVLAPTLGSAQVFQLPTPVPQVTAANADWQLRGEPVFYQGEFYFPTGPTVFFDGNVMVRSGVHQGIPLYADGTLEPYSLVFVPIGRNVMRPYEKRRAGLLAGTTGSRPSSLPIEQDAERSLAVGTAGVTPANAAGIEPAVIPESVRPVGTGGPVVTRPVAAPAGRSTNARRANARTSPVATIPAPRSNGGIWLEFGGSRWRSAGAAVPYLPEQFAAIGTYRGFPVYQKRGGSTREIYIPSVTDGPLAPFVR